MSGGKCGEGPGQVAAGVLDFDPESVPDELDDDFAPSEEPDGVSVEVEPLSLDDDVDAASELVELSDVLVVLLVVGRLSFL
jgi:hypothetical protein